jgi:cytochrome P450
MKIYPHYPKPVKNKVSQLMTFFKKSSSWLDSVYERSYTMRMGRVKMPGVDLYIPNEPELVHRVLVKEAKLFPKHPMLHEALSPVLGESIFTTNGNVWRKQRELLNPSFEMVRIKHVFDLMNEAAKDMVERLDRIADGKYHNLDEEMTFVTADIIFRTIMSEKLTAQEGRKVIDAFVLFQEKSAKIGMQKMFLVPKIFRMFGDEQAYKRSGNIIRESLSRIIKPRYEAMEKNQVGEERDILSTLLKVIDEDTGKPFTFKEILDQIAMLFLAGHETTASSMTWTLYLLGLYPEIQEQAYQEVRDICKDDAFTAENTKELTLVTKIFKESLRLYPPVSFFARMTTQETKMRDKVLKKGSAIVISAWLMQRNERYWEDPHMFNPHRFDNPKDIHKNTYFPFGLGQRICIGEKFAMQEAVLLLASILRNFKIELEEGFVPDIAGRLTTRSLNGMSIKLIKRT